jgi:hypothetical protein
MFAVNFFIPRKGQLDADHMYQVAFKLYKDVYRKPIETLPYSSLDFVQAQLTLFQMV